MLYIDYRSKVLLKYKTARQAKNLPPFLMQPTPANLRSECVHVCQERFDKKDQEILRTFFGPQDNQRAYIRAIGEFDVNKFRPLLNFITERTVDTELKNIELLAWLVDFKPRPFDSSYKEPANEPTAGNNEKAAAGGTESPNIDTKINESVVVKDGEANLQGEQQKSIDKRYVLISGIALFFIAAIIYLLLKWPLEPGCMYWNGDHYETVACDQQVDNALVIAADSSRVKYFKKITRPDTVTLKSIGHVWYSKINNKIEFFTASGYHPIYPYYLKPITKYIIEKYAGIQYKDTMTTIR